MANPAKSLPDEAPISIGPLEVQALKEWPEIERLRSLNGELITALNGAIETIHAWHGDVAWDIYLRSSPEMRRITRAIAKAEGR